MDRQRARTWLDTRLRYLRANPALRRRMIWGFIGLCVLGAVWIVVTGLLARQQVVKLNDRLQAVKILVAENRIPEARKAAEGVPALARRANLLTSGPAWWTAAHVPYLGDPLKVMRVTTAAGKQVGADGVITLMDAATKLDPATLRARGNTIKLGPLEATAPTLSRQAAILSKASERIDHLPSHTWFGPVNRARASIAVQLHSIVGYVDAAANTTRVLPTMLGAERPMRYFVGLQNEAEMRGTGGLPGAFAIVVADKGTIRFTHFLSDAALLPPGNFHHLPTGLDFGEDYEAAYGSTQATQLIVDSNVSPHFPYAARIWAAMWEKVSGEKIDGAMAVDPTALSYFLNVTGPVRLPSGMVVGAQNIVSLTEKDEYTMFTDNFARKDFLVSILKAASTKLTSGVGSAGALAKTITTASKENRLQVWSASPAIESVIERTSYSGAIPKGTRPFGGLVVNNTAAGKLDYYLTREMDYRRSGCGRTRDVYVTIKLSNLAPGSGLPPYVVARIDPHRYPTEPGDNRALVDYYATTGAQLLSADLNDKPVTIQVTGDLGKKIFRFDMELPHGATQVLTLHLQEPAGSGTPQIWKQPGVTPLKLTYFNQNC